MSGGILYGRETRMHVYDTSYTTVHPYVLVALLICSSAAEAAADEAIRLSDGAVTRRGFIPSLSYYYLIYLFYVL